MDTPLPVQEPLAAAPYRAPSLPDPADFPAVYGPESIAIATFLGSALAGAVLWALNERRTGRSGRVWAVMAVGVGVVAAQFAIGSVLPSGALGGACLGVTLAARHAAVHWQSGAQRAGRLERTRPASRGHAVGVGLAMMLLVLAGFVGVAALAEPPSVEIRPGDRVFYLHGVTADDARRLGARLQALGFFDGTHTVDVRYERIQGGHALSMVVSPARAVSLQSDFQQFCQTMRPWTDPTGHLELRLCDDTWDVHHRFTAP